MRQLAMLATIIHTRSRQLPGITSSRCTRNTGLLTATAVPERSLASASVHMGFFLPAGFLALIRSQFQHVSEQAGVKVKQMAVQL
jgi:hypothetical protein